jgi:hypothetical protein
MAGRAPRAVVDAWGPARRTPKTSGHSSGGVPHITPRNPPRSTLNGQWSGGVHVVELICATPEAEAIRCRLLLLSWFRRPAPGGKRGDQMHA